MSAKQEKKIRRAARKRDRKVLPELKEFINFQPVGDRIRIAWRILLGRF